jgi:dihydroflavonol-4-reductase
LVTGGSGFIGSYLVAALVDRGYHVRILDVASPTNGLPNVEFVAGSILDGDCVRRALSGIDVVFHLAAIPHLWSADADDFDRINRHGTEVVLAAAQAAKVPRFVHCSSEAVLFASHPRDRIADETVSLSMVDMPGPYTRSKLAAEQAVLSAARRGLDAVVVSPAIPVGPGDLNVTPPTAMLKHLKERPPFYLDCILNLVDVRDVADGMILAAEHGRDGERYVLGGESIAFPDLMRLLQPVDEATTTSRRIPAWIALAAAACAEWIARHVTGRRPLASVEGVRLALRSVPVSSSKARRELGYAPGPVRFALKETWFALGHGDGVPAPSLDHLG